MLINQEDGLRVLVVVVITLVTGEDACKWL